MKKVYNYSRISKDEDKKNYGSIKTQNDIAKEYAEEQGWKIERTFEDDNVSGYIPIEDRPAFNELYNLVNESKENQLY